MPASAPAVVGRLSLATLGGGEWVLRGWSLTEPAPAMPEATLSIDGERVIGVSGCNRYYATARMSSTRPGELEIGPLAGTRLSCSEPAAGFEARYQKLLRRVQRASFLAGQLALVYRGERGEFGALLFEERRPGAVAGP